MGRGAFAAFVNSWVYLGRPDRVLADHRGLRTLFAVITNGSTGGGCPDGLRGRAIPVLSRIIAVADAFEAMTADRSYRSGLGVTVALEQLQTYAGTQFDAELVPVFLRAMG